MKGLKLQTLGTNKRLFHKQEAVFCVELFWLSAIQRKTQTDLLIIEYLREVQISYLNKQITDCSVRGLIGVNGFQFDDNIFLQASPFNTGATVHI